MTKRAHIIANGKVVNTILLEDDVDEGDFGAIPAPDDSVGVGWTFDGVTFSPPVLTPEEIAKGQVEENARTELAKPMPTTLAGLAARLDAVETLLGLKEV